ncbi:MAG: hypothetical protein JNM21_13710 [Taibaiella sp.]|nr:hypothetical protein [Taibaiella sp.]
MTKEEFTEEMYQLTSIYQSRYQGREPLLTWEDGQKPKYHPDFLKSLPEDVYQKVQELINSL